MDGDSIRNSILLGSYYAGELPKLDVPVTPRIAVPGVSRRQIVDAVGDLVKDGFVEIADFPIGFETELDPDTIPPLIMTPFGKQKAEGLRRTGIFNWNPKIAIVFGGGSVTMTDTTVHTETRITVQQFRDAVIGKIDNSTHPPAQKEEAKSRLQAFLSHPLVNTVLGAALGALLKT